MSHPSQTPDPQQPKINPATGGREAHQRAQTKDFGPPNIGTPQHDPYAGYGYGGQPINPYTGQPYPPAAPQQRKSNGFAITSLTLGLIGVLLFWIPLIGYVAFILGIVGAVFGVIGIFKSHRKMSIAGTVLSVLAVVFSTIAYVSLVNDLNKAVDGYNAAVSGTPVPSVDPDLEVEGEG
jgi:hypothetical protein